MTTLPADKLRAMCEETLSSTPMTNIELLEFYDADGLAGIVRRQNIRLKDYARTLLELLPAEGEEVEARSKVYTKFNDDYDHWNVITWAGKCCAIFDTQDAAIMSANNINEFISSILSRQPGGEGHGWRPIESAPKDGTYILAYPALSGIPLVVKWDIDFDKKNANSDKWRVALTAQTPPYAPTHWQPLPAPPSAAPAPAAREDR